MSNEPESCQSQGHYFNSKDVINMGDEPELLIRRVKTKDGKIALQIISEGYISAHGSSMQCFYITSSKEHLVKGLNLFDAPDADNQDTSK